MRKTILSLATLLTIAPSAVLAQGLPDEINYGPYHERYLQVRDQRDQVSSSLAAERNNLENILNNIQNEYSNIASYRQTIANLERERNDLNYELPRLERDIQQATAQANNVADTIEALNRRLEMVSRRVSNESAVLSNLNDKLREQQEEKRVIGGRLIQFQQKETELKRALVRLHQSIEHAEKDSAQAERSIDALKRKERTIDADISEAEAKVASQRSELESSTEVLRNLKSEEKEVSDNLKEASVRLRQLRTGNGSPEEVAAALEKVGKLRDQLQEVTKKVSSAEKNTNEDKRKLQKLVSVENDLKAEKKKIPAQIANLEREIEKNRKVIRDSRAAIPGTQRELGVAEENVQRASRRLAGIEHEIDKLKVDVRNQSEVVRDVVARRDGLAAEHAGQTASLNALNQTIANLDNRIRAIDNRLPQITSEISSNISYIGQAEIEIDRLEANRSNTEDFIASLEVQLSDLTAQTEQANSEYDRRLDLYNQYLAEAREIGRSQIGPAADLAALKGSEIAEKISNENSQALGVEVGRFEANLIGMVRGELQGYPAGYQDGYSDTTSRNQGQMEGRSAGITNAHNYAQANLKPGFFENYIAAELGKVGATLSSAMDGAASELTSFNEKDMEAPAIHNEVTNLSQEEISQAAQYSTSLDAQISNALAEEGKVWERSRTFSNADFVYVAPTTIPYQTVDCSSVYKDVSDFYKACNDSYKVSFKELYLAEAKSKFQLEYPSLYNDKFAVVESATRAELFEAELVKASDLAFGEAQAKGKKDGYNEEFDQAQTAAYSAEMPAATAKADSDAKVEVRAWIASNPAVTVQAYSFDSSEIRGGMSGSLIVDLKNIGAKNSAGVGTLKIVSAKNLEFSSSTYRLLDVPAKSSKKIAIPFKVSSDARSGEYATARVEVTLPGDKYKAQRVEVKDFQIKLSVNPTTKVDLTYDNSPNIKGWRSFYIHNFDLQLSPAIENVAEGYTIKLEADAASAPHMDFKKSSATTRGLSVGQNFKARFQYVFKKSADGKTITLYLSTFHKGKLVEKRPITLRPH